MPDGLSRAERLSSAQAQFERVMTIPAPDPSGAFMETGTLGFVFGELWQRAGLSLKDRRWITLTCAGVTGSATPIETHVWAALKSGDITYSEYDEFVLHFATQLGWPKASVLHVQGILSAFKLADEQQVPLEPYDYEPLGDIESRQERLAAGAETYRRVHGRAPSEHTSSLATDATLGFLYGEVWSRTTHLTRRERRIISICCTTAAQAADQTAEHLEAALSQGELTVRELQEIALHVGVYLGWIQARQLNELVTQAARSSSNEMPGPRA